MITGDEALYLARKFIQDKVAEALYSVGRLLQTKVDKIDGKGLSSNDFSDTFKTKLDNVSLIEVVTPSFSSLPKTFYSSVLKSNCKVVGDAIELSYPKAGSIDWNVTFANGSLTISGTFKGTTATTASMSIWIPTQTITLSATQ